MAESEATYQSFDGVELEVPEGPIDVPMEGSRVVRCRPLKVGEAVQFLRLLDRAQQGDGDAFMRLCDEFPAAVGIEDVELTVSELFDVIRRFCRSRRTGPGGTTIRTGPEKAKSSTTGSTT